MLNRKIAVALAGAALIAGLGVAAPATIGPVERASAASCSEYIPGVPTPPQYRVILNPWGGAAYYYTYSAAYAYLHNPVSRTGTIEKKVGTLVGKICATHWQTIHFDTSKTR